MATKLSKGNKLSTLKQLVPFFGGVKNSALGFKQNRKRSGRWNWKSCFPEQRVSGNLQAKMSSSYPLAANRGTVLGSCSGILRNSTFQSQCMSAPGLLVVAGIMRATYRKQAEGKAGQYMLVPLEKFPVLQVKLYIKSLVSGWRWEISRVTYTHSRGCSMKLYISCGPKASLGALIPACLWIIKNRMDCMPLNSCSK